ncbi:MAG: C39 family peptidase [Spiroplasma sp.]|nr:C39 family peptidase [Spiroplasma sp.]
MHKYLSALVTLTLSTSTILPISTAINLSLTDQKQNFNIRQNAPNKIMLNVKSADQDTPDYCVPAVLQVVFDYYGFQYTQDYIYEQMGGSEGSGINIGDNNNINWINNQLDSHNVNTRYHQIDVPQNFGATSQDQSLFQNFVISSLNQGVPIIMATRNAHMNYLHATVLYGIEVDEENPSETLYYYRDPMFPEFQNQNGVSFEANELSGLFSGRDCFVLAPNRNFDFENRKITVSTPNQTFGGSLQDKTIELNQAVNLTKDAGITTLSQLKQFKKVELLGYFLSTSWFARAWDVEGENWMTKYFVEGQKPFMKNAEQSWGTVYNSVARGEFTTKYSSSTWLEEDKSFYLNFSYQFYARALLTTTLIYVKIFLGSKWVLTF